MHGKPLLREAFLLTKAQEDLWQKQNVILMRKMSCTQINCTNELCK